MWEGDIGGDVGNPVIPVGFCSVRVFQYHCRIKRALRRNLRSGRKKTATLPRNCERNHMSFVVRKSISAMLPPNFIAKQ